MSIATGSSAHPAHPPSPEPSLPFHLRGNFAPVMAELTAFELPLKGAVPRPLHGLYARNGPNPKSGQSPHWFGPVQGAIA
jgi:carotenoid cleavage dioxygenase-like enzyme